MGVSACKKLFWVALLPVISPAAFAAKGAASFGQYYQCWKQLEGPGSFDRGHEYIPLWVEGKNGISLRIVERGRTLSYFVSSGGQRERRVELDLPGGKGHRARTIKAFVNFRGPRGASFEPVVDNMITFEEGKAGKFVVLGPMPKKSTDETALIDRLYQRALARMIEMRFAAVQSGSVLMDDSPVVASPQGKDFERRVRIARVCDQVADDSNHLLLQSMGAAGLSEKTSAPEPAPLDDAGRDPAED